MTLRLLSPALLIALLFTYPTQTTKWETANGDGFTVQMPGTPRKETQGMDTALGKSSMTMFFITKGGETFGFTYYDYPDTPAFRNADPEELLDKARDGAVREANGRVTSQKPLTMSGHPGKEFSGDTTSREADSSGKHQEASFTARLYWVAPRLYLVIHVGPKGGGLGEDGQKFLDSFRLTEQ